jgi:hypothetical protein
MLIVPLAALLSGIYLKFYLSDIYAAANLLNSKTAENRIAREVCVVLAASAK